MDKGGESSAGPSGGPPSTVSINMEPQDVTASLTTNVTMDKAVESSGGAPSKVISLEPHDLTPSLTVDKAGESSGPSGGAPSKVISFKPEDLTGGSSEDVQFLWSNAPPSTCVKRKSPCGLDLDTLNCPICVQPLSPPVYQCRNGHTTCGACCKRLMKRCASCSTPIGSTRNLALEKILESVQVGCMRVNQGCQEMLKYTEKKNHEEHFCKFRPYQCPVPSCMHKCTKGTLPLHLERVHEAKRIDVLRQRSIKIAVNQGYVILQEGEEVLGLVHHEHWPYVGHIFFCTSFQGSDILCNLGVKFSFGTSHNSGPRLCNSLEVVLHSNQGVEGSVLKVKERGEFVVVPQLSIVDFQISQFELQISISRNLTNQTR